MQFGFTREYVEELYSAYNEKIPQEARAREELIKQAADKHWIRICHYSRPRDYWAIQFDRYQERLPDLVALVTFLISQQYMCGPDELVLTCYRDNQSREYPHTQGESAKFLANNANETIGAVIELGDFTGMQDSRQPFCPAIGRQESLSLLSVTCRC